MERLGHSINQTVEEGGWKPLKMSHYSLPLSHMFFADDLLLFVYAFEKQIEIIIHCLNNFCALAGQKINLQKSNIAFSVGVDETMNRKISAYSKIPITSRLDKYLGVPPITRRLTLDLFQHVLYRLDGRLERIEISASYPSRENCSS